MTKDDWRRSAQDRINDIDVTIAGIEKLNAPGSLAVQLTLQSLKNRRAQFEAEIADAMLAARKDDRDGR